MIENGSPPDGSGSRTAQLISSSVRTAPAGGNSPSLRNLRTLVRRRVHVDRERRQDRHPPPESVFLDVVVGFVLNGETLPASPTGSRLKTRRGVRSGKWRWSCRTRNGCSATRRLDGRYVDGSLPGARKPQRRPRR